MTRQEKYPETPTFHYHQANPHKRINGDCVVRAISVFLGITWTVSIHAPARGATAYSKVH